MNVLSKSNTLIIVPAFNEQDSIVSVITEIKTTGFPYIVIDDGSTDGTRKRAIGAGARTISLPFNAGVGGALKCGFRFAIENGYEAVVQVDADGQHDPTQIQELIRASDAKKADLVIGNRFNHPHSTVKLNLMRKTAMKGLSKLVTYKVRASIYDTTSGFRIIRQPLLGEFSKSFSLGYLGDTVEALVVAGAKNYRVVETSVPIRQRLSGTSSASDVIAMSRIVRSVCVILLGVTFQILDKECQS